MGIKPKSRINIEIPTNFCGLCGTPIKKRACFCEWCNDFIENQGTEKAKELKNELQKALQIAKGQSG